MSLQQTKKQAFSTLRELPGKIERTITGRPACPVRYEELGLEQFEAAQLNNGVPALNLQSCWHNVAYEFEFQCNKDITRAVQKFGLAAAKLKSAIESGRIDKVEELTDEIQEISGNLYQSLAKNSQVYKKYFEEALDKVFRPLDPDAEDRNPVGPLVRLINQAVRTTVNCLAAHGISSDVGDLPV